MTECLFCKIVTGEVSSYKIYENDKVMAFLDIHPVSDGHTLVIPKAHAENLAENTLEDAYALMAVIHELAPKITAAMDATGYNLGMNHGEVAGQVIPHTHLHIMPRRAGEPRTFTKGNPNPDELVSVAEKIKLALT